MTILQGNDLVKLYGQGDGTVYAVNHVHFSVNAGEFCVITGASGSGKSTLLELCGGMTAPTGGELRFHGQVLRFDREEESADYRLRKTGFVFQTFELMKNLTLEENIAMPALIAGRRSFHGQVRELAERVGITERLSHFPDKVSGGERQRCAIARSLMNDPEIIFADEPTGNLDSGNAREILRLLLEINGRGTTVMLVTHDQGILRRILSEAANPRWFVMSNGSLTVGDTDRLK